MQTQIGLKKADNLLQLERLLLRHHFALVTFHSGSMVCCLDARSITNILNSYCISIIVLDYDNANCNAARYDRYVYTSLAAAWTL